MSDIIKRQEQRVTATIIDIEIVELFGTYSYSLPGDGSARNDLDLIVLYGDNGSGKSTILKLLFHLLNPEPYNGHRSFVGSIPFRQISIRLSSNCVVKASRNDPYDLDTYVMSICDPSMESPMEWVWIKDSKSKRESDYFTLCKYLSDQGINLHFLQDSRRTEKIEKHALRRHVQISEEMHLYRDVEIDPLNPNTLVQSAVEDTMQWFQREVLAGTNEGQSSVNAVYSRLIETLISTHVESGSDSEADTMALQTAVQKLENLEILNKEFSIYGLIADLDTSVIRRHLGNVPPEKARLLNTVLDPYIEGHMARLNALTEVQSIINTFVGLLTEFYKGKQVKVIVGGPFIILSDQGRPIPVEFLSSGEKHLLLLFCNAILARAHGTILIIDEPEISLNIKWQRRLVQALKSCMKGVRCQLIVATHSFEILAGNDQYVRQLINQEEGRTLELF
jgi:energy-coupling factor transporter ATP-binding protein EcfA2